jgi:uncharacterized protein with GYD domain
MKTYVVLLNLTEKGVATITEGMERMASVSKHLDGIGGRIKDFYLTMGGYDFVVIFEVPGDIEMAKLLLTIGRLGAARTTTMRAFGAEDYAKILEGLS